MDAATFLGRVENVLKNMESRALDKIASALGFKTQLEELKNTINTIKKVLLDAGEREVDNQAARDSLQRLSTVVDAVDDLVDEFNIVAARKELMDGHKLFKKVCTFFSHSNQVVVAHKVSKKFKKIKKELDDIEKDGTMFDFVRGFPERGSATSRRRVQTASYVDEAEVVGREDDKKAVLKMLLGSSSTEHDEGLAVIPIVGTGGMGKTTLAQLVYNDPKVKEHFDLRLWVCVPHDFDIKEILEKLLKSATYEETPDHPAMELLQVLWRNEVANKKYLVVLDDVCNENREQWIKLETLLKMGRKGSKILVTTRSKGVAIIMGNLHPYELQGLKEGNSWILFKLRAFKPGEAEQMPHLVKIGEEIVKNCGNIPVAITTLGNILYGQEEEKWMSVRDASLTKTVHSQSDIIEILKNSYNHLPFVRGSPKRGSATSRRRETCSYVDKAGVVGREDDKKAILKMLLGSSSTEHENEHDEGLAVFTIVGTEGMGKTTLAQLIYNDPQVEEHFDLRLWVCVSDVFDIQVIIDRLLKVSTDREIPNLEIDQLQGLLRNELADKKYLLVLDDMCNENREQWINLRMLLKIGRKGSKILVTTRSKGVAVIMGNSHPYELQGLKEENSWILFKERAFRNGQAEQLPHLVKIGEEIVKNCGNIPLAIRISENILYGQEEERKWVVLRDAILEKAVHNQSDIIEYLENFGSPRVKELNDRGSDGEMFEFVPDSWRVMRMRETISYVDKAKVVGREDDKKAILKMLLESSSTGHDEELLCISIVGMGGMGKTTLAQLIYNDPQVEDHFDLRLWVCVSDVFNTQVIIGKLLKSATNKDTSNVSMDILKIHWRAEMANKKYLIVLDDVWNEDRRKWYDLIKLLAIGRKGTKILVTTRLMSAAKNMYDSHPYELQGLKEENSWSLFEQMAFNPGEAEQMPHLVKIGKQIVRKCGNIPLVIRTIGSVLYGQEERQWLLLRDTSLTNIIESQSDIINILKLSYNQLESPLKDCYAYCALFPKDYVFEKKMLIDLWIAEGFIVPIDEHQSIDDAAEEYIYTLVQRGFFQDIKLNGWEEIESCKMQGLMHDLAQSVAGVKYKVAKSDEQNFDERIVHLSLAYQLTSSWDIPVSKLNMKQLRSFHLPQQIKDWSSFSYITISKLLMEFRSLRVLNLNSLGIKSLPSSIGKLNLLRFLNLSMTPIEYLPDSITDLWNLQTLKLDWCTKLRTLPADMWKLTNLRTINVAGCYLLSHMPSGLGGLTSLRSLPRFPVAADSQNVSAAKLSDLKKLNKLKGSLEIDVRRGINVSEVTEAELSNKYGLTELIILLPRASDCKYAEDVLEGLKPPSDIKSLGIYHYRGQNLSSWATMENLCTTLPNLVEISLDDWNRCQQLPAFSQLPSLKRLKLSLMDSVEYIESNVCGVPSSTSSRPAAIFFPSLEQVHLFHMKNLKGWWKQVEESEYEDEISESASNGLAGQIIPTTFMEFSKVSKLSIIDCPKLRLLPLCPNVEDLTLQKTNEALSVVKMATTSSSSSMPSSSSTGGSGLKLKKLSIDNAEDLMSLPNDCLHQLSSLEVYWDNKLESMDRLEDVFTTLSSSLRSLRFWKCHKLRSIARGVKHLTTLESLELDFCVQLDVSEDGEGMLWKSLNTSLRSLTLSRLLRLVRLPSGLQNLANLRSLYLIGNRELEEIPEWISCFSSLEYLQLRECSKLTSLPIAFSQLTSLNNLEVIKCPGLTKRCQEGPDGSEWPKIKHIPHISVRDLY